MNKFLEADTEPRVVDEVPDQYVKTRVDVEALKRSVNIVDLIKAYPGDIGEIEPFHGDLWKGTDRNGPRAGHPSVHVNEREGWVKWYSQNWGGDHISHLQRHYGMSFWRAVQTLQDMAGGRFESAAPVASRLSPEAQIPPPPPGDAADSFCNAIFEDVDALHYVKNKWQFEADRDIAPHQIGVGKFWVKYDKGPAVFERSITFPMFVDGVLWNIRYRIMNPRDPARRYGFMVSGRSTYPVGLDHMDNDYVVICEGEAKRITLYRELADKPISIVGLCGMGSFYPNMSKGGESPIDFMARFHGKTVFIALDGGQHPFYQGVLRTDGVMDRHPRSWVVDMIDSGIDVRGISLPGQADDFILQPGGAAAFMRMLRNAEKLKMYAGSPLKPLVASRPTLRARA